MNSQALKEIISLSLVLAALTGAGSANAWMYWYYYPVPYAPVHSWYMNLPAMPSYASVPPVTTMAWQMHLPLQSSGVFIEQAQLPTGYRYRIHLGPERGGDVRIGFELGALVVRSDAVQSMAGSVGSQGFGSWTQWLSLPVDADPTGMRWSLLHGILDIFIPRRYP